MKKESSNLPKISIITPSYNQGRFIERTIQSVLAQNYPNFEHIVIDGGSTDETIDILKKYPHIVWISEKDTGQADALNKGFKLAVGEILAWINSDDYYLKEAFYNVAETFKSAPDIEIVVGESFLYFENSLELHRSENRELDFEALIRYWDKWIPPTQPSVFFKSSLIKRIGMLDADLYYAMDYDFWIRAAMESSFLLIPQSLAVYRFHGKSKSGLANWSPFYPEYNIVYQRYKHYSQILPKGPLLSIIFMADEKSCKESEWSLSALKESIELFDSQKIHDMEILIITDLNDLYDLMEIREGPIPRRIIKLSSLTELSVYEIISKEAKGEFLYFTSQELPVNFKWFSKALTSMLINEKVFLLTDEEIHSTVLSQTCFGAILSDHTMIRKSLFIPLGSFSFPHTDEVEVSVIVTAVNCGVELYNCLCSIYHGMESVTYEVLLVYDSLYKELEEIILGVKNLILIKDESAIDYYRACNIGSMKAKGKYILFMNSHILPDKEMTPYFLSVFKHYPNAGAVSPKLLYPNNTIRDTGKIIWNNGALLTYGQGDGPDDPEHNFLREIDLFARDCFIIKKELLISCNGFDEYMIDKGCADADFCFAMREQNYTIYYQYASVATYLNMTEIFGNNRVSIWDNSINTLNRTAICDKWNDAIIEKHWVEDYDSIIRARRFGGKPEILIIGMYNEMADGNFELSRLYKIIDLLHRLGFSVTLCLKGELIPDNDNQLKQKGVEIIYALDKLYDSLEKRKLQFDFVWLGDEQLAIAMLRVIKILSGDIKIIYGNLSDKGDSHSQISEIKRAHHNDLAGTTDLTVVFSSAGFDYYSSLQSDTKKIVHLQEGFNEKDLHTILNSIKQHGNFIRTDLRAFNEMFTVYKKAMDYKSLRFSRIEKIDSSRRTFIWGAGKGGEETLYMLLSLGIAVHGFIDSSPQKWNRKLCSLWIYPSYYLHTYAYREKNRPFIVIASMAAGEIESGLRELGYEENKDYLSTIFIH